MEGKILVFEGLDGSGKETQTKLLEKRLKDKGMKVVRIEFPNYDNKYSLFVKEYLNGNFGEDVDPYVVSVFFSLDRFGIYKSKIKQYIDDGYIVICDRYVYSNLIYQGSRIEDDIEREKYFEWILDFEYEKCGILRESITFFIDVSIDLILDVIKARKSHDIYEKNEKFLRKCYENCKKIYEKYNLVHIDCCDNGKFLPVEEIGNIIYDKVSKILNI